MRTGGAVRVGCETHCCRREYYGVRATKSGIHSAPVQARPQAAVLTMRCSAPNMSKSWADDVSCVIKAAPAVPRELQFITAQLSAAKNNT